MKASGEHIIEPDGSGSKVTLVASATGLLATLFAPVAFFTTRGNVRTEAEGLKRRCEREAGIDIWLRSRAELAPDAERACELREMLLLVRQLVPHVRFEHHATQRLVPARAGPAVVR